MLLSRRFAARVGGTRAFTRALSTTTCRQLGAWSKFYPPVAPPKSTIREVDSYFVEQRPNGPVSVPSIGIPMGLEKPVVLSTSWLRDNCPCDICINQSSGQKTFATSDVARRPAIEHMERMDDSGLKIVWVDEGLDEGTGRVGVPHASVYSWSWLQKLLHPPAFSRFRQWSEEWRGSSFSPKSIDYSEWMENDGLFEEALLSLDRTGIIFVQGVPRDETSIEHITSRIGHIYPTFYGRTWDVRSKQHAENVAYTNEFLGLHQDLMYKSDPPRIQILHCLDNSCPGGESIFSDGRVAARSLSYTEYQALSRWPIRYGYDRNGHLYNYERPVFSGDLDAEYRHEYFKAESHEKARAERQKHIKYWVNVDRCGDVNGYHHWMLAWSPPFQSQQFNPFSHNQTIPLHEKETDGFYKNFPTSQWHLWLNASKKFRNALEDSNNVFEHRLEPGDCVLFDNWRVLHGRKAFDTASGDRWLKGTYMDHQEFDSKVRVTLRQRWENGSWQPGEAPRYQRLRMSRPRFGKGTTRASSTRFRKQSGSSEERGTKEAGETGQAERSAG